MLDNVVRYLEGEWSVIRRLPLAIALCVAVGFGLGFWIAAAFYGRELAAANRTLVTVTATRDFWKDSYERERDQNNMPAQAQAALSAPTAAAPSAAPPAATPPPAAAPQRAAPPAPAPSSAAPPSLAPPKPVVLPPKPVAPTKSPPQAESESASRAASEEAAAPPRQSGGANAVSNLGANAGRPSRSVGDGAQFANDLRSYGPQRIVAVGGISGNAESLSLAQQIVQGMKAAGWTAGGPFQAAFKSPVTGLVVVVGQTDTRKPGVQVSAQDLPPAAVAMMATAQKYGLQPRLTIDPRITDPSEVRVIVGAQPQ